ncbi:hypothetical protein N7466_009905 [Penicillium verhagenii]|uniref:uncharacterized protein n=1 Tax=Penicillium verhagenii TaxID=1562060 RepID=UPI002544F5F0|nr:uncharacterized protein N7466_009905 [Penicillium verhagenii]KAJ5918962.1 hypothetical protein N7466_009905 [Penicillium verhagenii]
MDDMSLEDVARQLSDIEVAVLLCLAAHEHCLIETTGDSIDDLGRELALICSNTFDLSFSILECGPETSIEEIHNDILTTDARKTLARPSYSRAKTGSSSNLSYVGGHRDRSKSPIPSMIADEPNVVNIIIAKNFNLTSEDFQVQSLQLMRTRQLVTEIGILNAPTDFLFVPLVARDSAELHPPLKTHLRDQLFISHYHEPEDGFIYLEENDWLSDGQLSASSVIHTPKYPQKMSAKVSNMVIQKLREASKSTTMNAEVVRYIQDIVVFLRLSRAVAGGISARANNQFAQLAQFLTPLHGIDYLTPSIVELAARKVFRHRIIVASPGDDRSLQYGSDLVTVSRVLAEVTPDSVLDGVLELEPPI